MLRRYVRPDPDEPDPAAREARALRLAGAAAVPTPALLAVDPDGTQAGVPALLMGRLPGRVWGDVVTVVGFLDDLHDDWGSERFAVEDMLARAVAELAG